MADGDVTPESEITDPEATILGDRTVSVRRVIAASPSEIFAVLSDASLHPVIDGSGTVRKAAGRVERLAMGSRFGMRMQYGIPYVIANTVVEFDQDRRIAWAHFGKHRWRYELEPLDDVDGAPRTRVTETFDWSTAIAPKVIELVGYPRRHPASMRRTLERLDAFVVNRGSGL
ncbi:MAG: SRPBCC family protein [Microthrixaceae bacterium]